MKRTFIYILAVLVFLLPAAELTMACTSFLITRGASRDGSTMITYSADAHFLYGELYFTPAARYPAGTMLDMYDWESGKYLGQIAQASRTYSVVGYMNEHQVAIGETTFGGRPELVNSKGLMDYGNMIRITLQRSRSAREAIATIVSLCDEYGYYSSGESFSISDKDEVWIMEFVGKGEGNKGILWVARRIPDGYVSGHANQARITTFPLANGKTSISSAEMHKIFNPEVENAYAADVIQKARDMGWYSGSDNEFSFSDCYAPLDFGAARFCEARVWAGFNRVNKDMASYLDYALGHNLTNRMPLWIKPDNKLDVRDVMDLMRDYYQGTPMDISKNIGAGPYGNTVRWRPLTYEVDGVGYIQERATSTQQTAFSFVTQSRNWLPDPVGGILWFGVDDTYYTVYSPMYCGISAVPPAFAAGNGDLLTFSETSAFWAFNQVADYAYSRTSLVLEDIRARQDKLELAYIARVQETDRLAGELYAGKPAEALDYLTAFSVSSGENTVAEWKDLYRQLFVKFLDGGMKVPREIPPGYNRVNPQVLQPGYPADWNRKVVRDAGDIIKVVK